MVSSVRVGAGIRVGVRREMLACPIQGSNLVTVLALGLEVRSLNVQCRCHLLEQTCCILHPCISSHLRDLYDDRSRLLHASVPTSMIFMTIWYYRPPLSIEVPCMCPGPIWTSIDRSMRHRKYALCRPTRNSKLMQRLDLA